MGIRRGKIAVLQTMRQRNIIQGKLKMKMAQKSSSTRKMATGASPTWTGASPCRNLCPSHRDLGMDTVWAFSDDETYRYRFWRDGLMAVSLVLTTFLLKYKEAFHLHPHSVDDTEMSRENLE